MRIELTERAKDKGLMKMELFSNEETDHCIAGVVYEKRMKEGEVIEWLDPILIFKTPIKHGVYDKVVRLAEEAGILILIPEAKNLKSDYYGLSFSGHKTLVKSWGYTSNHLPPNKRWNETRMREAADNWLSDTVLLAEIVSFTWSKIVENMGEKEIITEIQQQYSNKHLIAN